MDILTIGLGVLIIFLFLILAKRAAKWAKKMPKGAYLFMALMPLISLFPIPPPAFKNVAKAKQEQPKRKEDNGDDKK
tara:strand:+ start:412 stop:642 length:231 start_codon:yes stop_codon:yes gene_type:complete